MDKNTHNNTTGSDIVRSDDRINETGEVFTPMELCQQMVSEIPESTLRDSTSTFLDPSAGSGNFLLALQTELSKYHDLTHINDNMLFGVELMEDNYHEMLDRLGINESNPHIVCADALLYDYSFGEAIGLESFMV